MVDKSTKWYNAGTGKYENQRKSNVCCHFLNLTTPQTISTTTINSFVLVNTLYSLTNNSDFIQPSNGTIQYTGIRSKIFLINFISCGWFSSNNRVLGMAIFKNGIIVAGSDVYELSRNSGQSSTLSGTFMVSLNQNDNISIRIGNFSNNSSYSLTSAKIIISEVNL